MGETIKLQERFYEKERKLQEDMNKELKLKIDLGFFYCDNECSGIGAKDMIKRKNFPLIHASELDND